MSESARDLLVRGVAAVKAGEAKEARFFLEWALRSDPSLDQRVEACLRLSEISPDPDEKRRWLEEVLVLRPSDPLARRQFAMLSGRLRREEIVDPDALPAASPGSAEVPMLRVDCPRCGAELLALAGLSRLGCVYCGAEIEVGVEGAHLRRRGAARTRSEPVASDLVVELARLRAHRPPNAALHVVCRGCGAIFLVPAETASLRCPYCRAVHVVDAQDTASRMAPDRVLLVQVDDVSAREQLRRWGEDQKVETSRIELQGIYLPFWAFSIAGEITSKETLESPRRAGEALLLGLGRALAGLRGLPPAYDFDGLVTADPKIDRLPLRLSLCVPATQRHPALLEAVARETSVAAAAAFEPLLLAGWLAETYDVPVSQAAIYARGEALDRVRSEAGGWFRGRESYDTSTLIIEGFELLLIPLWLGALGQDADARAVCVHGISGRVLVEAG